jgi:tetratricopeptide (TPR) repeat protein
VPATFTRSFRPLVVGLWLAAAVGRAADPAALVKEALAAEARFDSRTALELFRLADAARPNDPTVLQKMARQYSDLSFDTTDAAEQKRLCVAALACAERAVALAPKDPVNVLSLAVCYAKIGFCSDTRTKIADSRRVREYAEQALALDPNYGYAHHVLGQWHYEVASLGAATRMFVRLVYGGLPEASTAEGVRHLRRAVELEPKLPAHHAELGFALLADGQRGAARQEFEQALALPTCEKYDNEARRRVREALAKL